MVRNRFTKENRYRFHGGPGVCRPLVKGAKKPAYAGTSNDFNRKLSERKGQRYHSFGVTHTPSTRAAKALERRLINKRSPHRNKR